MLLHRRRQQRDAEQRRKQHRDDPGDSSDTAMTTNSVKVNSPAALLLRPTGMKPATVTSVPVSIGKAVEV
jgi:hypothetical protein